MTRKLSEWDKKQAEQRRKEKCQNGVKSWREDPTGVEAVRNILNPNKLKNI